MHFAAVHFTLKRFTTRAFMSRLRYFTVYLTPSIHTIITNIILFCRNLLRGGDCLISVACNPFRISCRNNRKIRDIVSSLPETSVARTDEPLARDIISLIKCRRAWMNRYTN